jgi:hypothetical protein
VPLSGFPPNSPIRSARSKSGEHHDTELGVGCRPKGVQAFSEPALELVGAHDGRLRRGTVCPRVVATGLN